MLWEIEIHQAPHGFDRQGRKLRTAARQKCFDGIEREILHACLLGVRHAALSVAEEVVDGLDVARDQTGQSGALAPGDRRPGLR